MALLDDIQAYLAAHPELASSPDWEVADILNTPDDAYPCYVDFQAGELASYWVEQGMLDDLVGLLSSETKAVRNLGYACRAVYDRHLSQIRCTDEAKRAAFYTIADSCLALGVCTQEQRDHIVSMGNGTQSWAKAHGCATVTARDVGLARGAK